MNEIKSSTEITSGHTKAIQTAAKKLPEGLSELGTTQRNQPESAMVGSVATIRAAVVSLEQTLS